MAFVPVASELPNLKIEIENDLDEAMETDDEDQGEEKKTNNKEDAKEIEEGEVSDSKDDEPAENIVRTPSIEQREREKRYENKAGGFVTGVDIFGKDVEAKLDERAKRFGLDASETKPLSQKQLKRLHESLGIKPIDTPEKLHRLEAIHMRGTEDMSTQDIFDYFRDYAPASIEWINDYSCNVVWMDSLSASRAMLGLSKTIVGLEEYRAKDPFLKDKEENVKDNAVVVNKGSVDEDVEMEDREQETSAEKNELVPEENNKEENGNVENSKYSDEPEEESIKAADIQVPIPPGMWRLGATCSKSKGILMRFATRSDRKTPRAEKLSDYYKKYGNPNYGGIKGIITSSRKRRFREGKNVIDPREMEDEKNPWGNSLQGKNPWGSLAESWGNMDRDRGRRKPDPYDRESPPRKMTPPPSPQITRSNHHSGRSSAAEDSESSSSSNGTVAWTKRNKRPRMRMYADDEQARIEKRKAQNQKNPPTKSVRMSRKDDPIKNRTPPRKQEDLRHRIGSDSRGRVQNSGSASVWNRLDRRHLREVHSETDSEVAVDDEAGWALEDEDYTDLRDSLGKKNVEGDLRSKLNKKKNLRQKSPLQIEFDNDEYYRLIGSDNE